MTALLSPLEAEEVTRFGVHDPEVWEQIVEHSDEDLSCERCDSAAAWSLVTRCCGTCAATLCDAHRAECEEVMRHLTSLGVFFSCKTCGHYHLPPASYPEIFREVQL